MTLIVICGFAVPQMYAQNGQVAGTEVDAGTDTPITGAVVQVKGTTNGCETDPNGEFTLNGLALNQILIVSCLGFESQEIIWTETCKIFY